MKSIAMIPVMYGSTRIRNKSKMLVNGYPLVYYVVRACKEADVFKKIYINSEHNDLKKIAQILEVDFFRRDPQRGGSKCTMVNKASKCKGVRCVTHDHFITDFLEKIKCENIVQVHTTSPLLESNTIKMFVKELEKGKFDSLFAIEEIHKEFFFNNNPINFSKTNKKGTQTLNPLKEMSWALSGWKRTSWLNSYYEDNENKNGPTFCGEVGLFPINKIEALDADDWDDLFIIEACLNHKKKKKDLGTFFLNDRIISIESNLNELLLEDGIKNIHWDGINTAVSNIENIKSKMGPPPWNYMLTYTDVDQAGIFCQDKGEGARYHCHVTKAEWWYVYEGSFDWLLDGGKKINAKAGEFVFLPKGTVHAISCTSDEPGIRIAFGGRDFEHIYVKKK